MRKRMSSGSADRVGGKMRRAKIGRSQFAFNNVDLRPIIFRDVAAEGKSALAAYLALVAIAKPVAFGRLLVRMLDDELKAEARAKQGPSQRGRKPVRYETYEEVLAEMRSRGLDPNAIIQTFIQLGSKGGN